MGLLFYFNRSAAYLRINMKFLYNLEEELNKHDEDFKRLFGLKAYALFVAKKTGCTVPQTWLFSSDAYEIFLEDNAQIEPQNFYSKAIAFLKEKLDDFVLGMNIGSYAVRSSAVEGDMEEAAIFNTFLSVSKGDLTLFVAKIWARAFSKETKAKIAVMIQPLIFENYAGIAFSRHPSPRKLEEKEFIVIDYCKTGGEAGALQEERSYRLSGDVAYLKANAKENWIVDLIEAICKLKQAQGSEIDVQFIVDEEGLLWVLMQKAMGPISQERALDLRPYMEKKRGHMNPFDIELLIEGVCQFLPQYLEFSFRIDPWIVMTTGDDGVQRLWYHRRYFEAIIDEVKWKIQTDSSYLPRIAQRYESYHKFIASTLYTKYVSQDTSRADRLKMWWKFMLPLSAHEIAPCLVLEALESLLLAQMQKIDPLLSKSELMEIRQYQTKDVGGRGYFDRLILKYCVFKEAKEWIKAYRKFAKLSVDSQKDILHARQSSFPLFEEIGRKLVLPIDTLWKMSYEDIRTCLLAKSPDFVKSFEFSNRTIFRLEKKTIVTLQMKEIHS